MFVTSWRRGRVFFFPAYTRHEVARTYCRLERQIGVLLLLFLFYDIDINYYRNLSRLLGGSVHRSSNAACQRVQRPELVIQPSFFTANGSRSGRSPSDFNGSIMTSLPSSRPVPRTSIRWRWVKTRIFGRLRRVICGFREMSNTSRRAGPPIDVSEIGNVKLSSESSLRRHRLMSRQRRLE